MSSFLMNPASYNEPKFPPSEDYSQSNYIGPQSDYYRNVHNFGYPSRYDIEEKYSPNSVYSQLPLSCDNDILTKRLSHHPSSHPHHHPQQLQQHHQQLSPPQAHLQTPISTHTHSLQSASATTPVINSNNSSISSSNTNTNTTGNNQTNTSSSAESRLNGFSSPTSTDPDSPDATSGDSPESVPSPGSQGSPESTCSKDQQTGQPVIYPWMRKSQSGNNSSGNSGRFTSHYRILYCYYIYGELRY